MRGITTILGAVIIVGFLFFWWTNQLTVTTSMPFVIFHGITPTPTPNVPANYAGNLGGNGREKTTPTATPNAIALQTVAKDASCTALREMVFSYCKGE